MYNAMPIRRIDVYRLMVNVVWHVVVLVNRRDTYDWMVHHNRHAVDHMMVSGVM